MRLYRSMVEADDGLPIVGRSGRKLGIRPGNAATFDVAAVNDSDSVSPGGGGMSVAPHDPMHLLKHRRPPSLGGIGNDPVWYIESDDVGGELSFRQDRPSHGTIEPSRPMTLKEYEEALARTRSDWKLHCR
jgi:hypothetical protein